MKNRFIRITSWVLAFCLCLTMLPTIFLSAQAASYNASAAVSYANSHWNDGVGLCAEFVSKCLAAGGVTIPNSASYYSSSTQSYNNNSGTLGAYTNPYTCSASLLLYLSKYYTVITNPSSSQIDVGDVVFMYSGEWRDGHVGIIINKNNGTPTYAAHNRATNTGKFYSNYPCTYVVKMNGSIQPVTHTVDTAYGTNFTAYPKAEISAENILDAYHNQIDSTSCIWTSDKCTIHEVYTDGCCKVTYPLDAGGTKTVYSKISLFNTHTHNYTGARVYQSAHPHEITQRCVDYATCGGWIYTGENYEVKTCEQCWHADFNIDVSSVTVNVGESKTYSMSITGCWPDTVTTSTSFAPDNDVVKVTGSNYQLTFTGLKVGTTKLVMSVYSDSSKSHVIGSKTISITVTCSSHSYSYIVTTKPTTSSTGKLTGACSKCSGTTTVTLPKLSTTDYSYTVKTAATCTAAGTGRYTWKTTTYGSFYFDVTIAAKGHSYTNKVTVPTCTAQGYTTHTCSCGYSYKDTYTSATGHSYSYKATKAPTTSATGTLTGTCSKCKGTTTVTLPMLNSTDYSYAVKTAATCTAAGIGRYTWKTTTYGSFYFDVAIAAKGHSYTNKVTAPTCTAQGYTTHTCSCGYNYKDTYTNATGHSYSYKVTKAPTTSATGTLTGTCTKCSETAMVTLPKLNASDYSYSVKTEPTYTATGIGRYTWNTTAYGSFSFDVTLDKLETAGQIVVQNGSAAPGESVTVTIALKNNPGIASLKLRVSYGNILTLTNISYNTAIGGMSQQPQTMTSPVILNWFNGVADSTGDWTFATLTFVVSENAEAGDIADITISYNADDVYNIADQNVTFAVVNGTIEVADYLPGDINADGTVNNRDLTRLFQYLSDWNVEVNEPALDVNGDGSINNRDLTRLFQYLSDWNVEIH